MSDPTQPQPGTPAAPAPPPTTPSTLRPQALIFAAVIIGTLISAGFLVNQSLHAEDDTQLPDFLAEPRVSVVTDDRPSWENLLPPPRPAKPADANRTGPPATAPADRGAAAWEGNFPTILITEADRFVGRTFHLEGKVTAVHGDGKTTFLYFAPGRHSFYVAIMPRTTGPWAAAPQDYFLNKTVRVTGKIGMYEGRPQVRVDSAAQITLVREGKESGTQGHKDDGAAKHTRS